MALLSPPHLEDGTAAQKGSEPGCGQKRGHLELVHDIGQCLGGCACVLARVCQVSVSIASGCVCVPLSLLCVSDCMRASLSEQSWMCLSLCVTPPHTYPGR